MQQVALMRQRHRRAEYRAADRSRRAQGIAVGANPQVHEHKRGEHQAVRRGGPRTGGGNSWLALSHWRIVAERRPQAENERLTKIGGRLSATSAPFSRHFFRFVRRRRISI